MNCSRLLLASFHEAFKPSSDLRLRSFSRYLGATSVFFSETAHKFSQMADPFSVAASIVSVLSLAIQISQVAIRFGLDWKDAPKDVKAFMLELQSLQMSLIEIQTKLISSPSFEEAFQGISSALLSHLKADDQSKDSIKEAFENCEAQLLVTLNSLKAKEKSHRFGWDRFKEPFLSKSTDSAISQLQRQCRFLERLIFIDTAALVAHTRLEVKEFGKEHQEWHTAEKTHEILKWISGLSFEEKHRDVLSKLHPGTGQWLLNLDEFKAWRNGHLDFPPNLWCPGIRESTLT